MFDLIQIRTLDELTNTSATLFPSEHEADIDGTVWRFFVKYI